MSEFFAEGFANSSIKTCVVVQGNIRRGTDEVLALLTGHFDLVILSTWDDESQEKVPAGRWNVVLSRKPVVSGYSHRNLQRLSTAAGMRRAEELGATHVLKWRTDMLPTKLNVPQLLEWTHDDVASDMRSRLVTCAFRNLTVTQDWFSTVPDLFAFGDIEIMKMLWGDESFDYSLPMNTPVEMMREAGSNWLDRIDAGGLYCAEAELYSLFKSRLQKKLGLQLTHIQIAKNYMRLIDHRHLGICWFGDSGKFRSILQAMQHPWWTEEIWINGRPQVTEWGYPDSGLVKKFRRKYLTPWIIRREMQRQAEWYKNEQKF